MCLVIISDTDFRLSRWFTINDGLLLESLHRV
jgi:hypothetical protein